MRFFLEMHVDNFDMRLETDVFLTNQLWSQNAFQSRFSYALTSRLSGIFSTIYHRFAAPAFLQHCHELAQCSFVTHSSAFCDVYLELFTHMLFTLSLNPQRQIFLFVLCLHWLFVTELLTANTMQTGLLILPLHHDVLSTWLEMKKLRQAMRVPLRRAWNQIPTILFLAGCFRGWCRSLNSTQNFFTSFHADTWDYRRLSTSIVLCCTRAIPYVSDPRGAAA